MIKVRIFRAHRGGDSHVERQRAGTGRRTGDLGRLFLQRASAGDVDGVVALYELDAVLESPPGNVSTGVAAIRQVYQALLVHRPQFSGDVRPALHHGDLALTSTRFQGGATAEIARRQDDGTWLWIADQPTVG